jgi:hypothetical protein
LRHIKSPPSGCKTIVRCPTSTDRFIAAARYLARLWIIGREVIGLGSAQREIHLGVRSHQVENECFGVEAVFSSDRQERRVSNQVVARAARYDVAGGAALLGQPSATLDIGSERTQGRDQQAETAAERNSFHQRPPEGARGTARPSILALRGDRRAGEPIWPRPLGNPALPDIVGTDKGVDAPAVKVSATPRAAPDAEYLHRIEREFGIEAAFRLRRSSCRPRSPRG